MAWRLDTGQLLTPSFTVASLVEEWALVQPETRAAAHAAAQAVRLIVMGRE